MPICCVGSELAAVLYDAVVMKCRFRFIGIVDMDFAATGLATGGVGPAPSALMLCYQSIWSRITLQLCPTRAPSFVNGHVFRSCGPPTQMSAGPAGEVGLVRGTLHEDAILTGEALANAVQSGLLNIELSMSPLEHLVLIAVGLSVTYALGWAVKPFLTYVKKLIPATAPSAARKAQWKKVVAQESAGRWLGHLERLFFFGGFYLDANEAIAAWLAFKVASKWNVWTNVVAVPKEIPGVDPVDYLIARRRWGARVLTTFLVGSLSNVIAGFIGAAIARHAGTLVQYLGEMARA